MQPLIVPDPDSLWITFPNLHTPPTDPARPVLADPPPNPVSTGWDTLQRAIEWGLDAYSS